MPSKKAKCVLLAVSKDRAQGPSKRNFSQNRRFYSILRSRRGAELPRSTPRYRDALLYTSPVKAFVIHLHHQQTRKRKQQQVHKDKE